MKNKELSKPIKYTLICLIFVLALVICEAVGILIYKHHLDKAAEAEYTDTEPKTPYSELKAEDISSATLIYGVYEYELNELERSTLAAKLGEIVIYERIDTETVTEFYPATFGIKLNTGENVRLSAFVFYSGEDAYLKIGDKAYKSTKESLSPLDMMYDSLVSLRIAN